MKTFICFILCSLATLSLFAKDKKLETYPPDVSIQNSQVKVSLQRRRTPILRWEIGIYYLVKETGKWEEYFQATLRGSFNDAKYANEFRKKHQVYYAFQKPDQITDIKSSKSGALPHIRFRVNTFDQFWIDSKVTILEKSPFILFQCIGKSHKQLTPHWSVTFQKGPLIELVTETQVKASGTMSLNAKKIEGHSIHARFMKYCIAFKKNVPDFFAIFTVADGKRQIAQFPRKSGIGSAFLNTPFIVYGGTQKFDKTPHTAGHVAEGLYSEIKKLLANTKGGNK